MDAGPTFVASAIMVGMAKSGKAKTAPKWCPGSGQKPVKKTGGWDHCPVCQRTVADTSSGLLRKHT